MATSDARGKQYLQKFGENTPNIQTIPYAVGKQQGIKGAIPASRG